MAAPAAGAPGLAAQPARGDPPPQPEPIWAGSAAAAVAPAAPARGALWVSLALAATLLLCGGGAVSAYFLLRDADNPGAPDPATAVNRFLTAVYNQQDASAAERARLPRGARQDQSSPTGSREIKTYADGYQEPVFRWAEPTVANQGKDRATVSVQLTMRPPTRRPPSRTCSSRWSTRPAGWSAR